MAFIPLKAEDAPGRAKRKALLCGTPHFSWVSKNSSIAESTAGLRRTETFCPHLPL